MLYILSLVTEHIRDRDGEATLSNFTSSSLLLSLQLSVIIHIISSIDSGVQFYHIINGSMEPVE